MRLHLTIAALAISAGTQAWAINKCTGPDGRPVFQDTPCLDHGETVGEELARREKVRQQLLAQKQKETEVRATIAATRRAEDEAEAQRRAAMAAYRPVPQEADRPTATTASSAGATATEGSSGGGYFRPRSRGRRR